MSSLAQIEANRRNAQRSTGPRSAEGKKRASLNALSHGLRCEKVVAGPEDRALYDLLRDQLLDEWRPGSVMEVLLVERMAEMVWRLRRVAGVETEMIEKTPMPRPPGMDAKFFDPSVALARDLRSAQPALLRVQLYQMRLERGLQRALNDLRRLQIERQMQDERAQPQMGLVVGSQVGSPIEPAASTPGDLSPEGERPNIENGRTNPILCG